MKCDLAPVATIGRLRLPHFYAELPRRFDNPSPDVVLSALSGRNINEYVRGAVAAQRLNTFFRRDIKFPRHSTDQWNMTAIQSLIKRFKSAWYAWSQVPETAYNREEVWFAGLAVAPVDFSNQLSKLQISLQREGAPSPLALPTESVADKRR